MVTQQKKRSLVISLAVLVLWLAAPAVVGQAAAPPAAPAAAPAPGAKTREEKLADTWENLIHYIRIGQEVAAVSNGQALLGSGAKPSEIYYLSARTPGALAALARARGMKGMEDISTKLLAIIEQGYKTERSDPEQIKKAIDLLGGTQRAYLRGRDRLVLSGEYAVPQLLRRLADPEITNVLREKIMVVLPQIGRQAVLPLAAASVTKDPHLRQVIALTLGRIEYPHAIPRLMEMYQRNDLQTETRRMVQAALVSCAGGDNQVLTKPISELYYDLALKFYYRAESLLPDKRSPTANVWYWDTDLGGLTFKPVPRQIFCDIYAMRMARLALQHDPKCGPAVSLWLAANLKRHVDLGGGKDPTRTPEEPSAQFYVLAAGAEYQQDVLARALRDKNWPVAVLAIEALGGTAGAESLVKPMPGGMQPLVEALSSPNRVVRYWAAISLAGAMPTKSFAGSDLVVRILADAMRQTGKKAALIVAADEARRNALKDAARAGGYEVVEAADATTGLAAARATAGVDVAILASNPDPMLAIGLIRRDPFLATLPLVVTAQTERFRELIKDDPRVRLTPATAAGEEVTNAVNDIVAAAAGAPLTAEQASAWAVRAGQAVRDLSLTGNPVFNVAFCRPALTAALQDPRPEVKVIAAEALATMPGPKAQGPIADLAIDPATDEAIRLKAFAALGQSVRRFGNSLSDKQAEAIVTIVAKQPTGPIRDAAAQILGALSLPSEKIKDLILREAGAK